MKPTIVFALVFLILAIITSTILWADVSAPVKIGMFAFGFGSGISVGMWLVRRSQ